MDISDQQQEWYPGVGGAGVMTPLIRCAAAPTPPGQRKPVLKGIAASDSWVACGMSAGGAPFTARQTACGAVPWT
jgi:hypothetical protein